MARRGSSGGARKERAKIIGRLEIRGPLCSVQGVAIGYAQARGGNGERLRDAFDNPILARRLSLVEQLATQRPDDLRALGYVSMMARMACGAAVSIRIPAR